MRKDFVEKTFEKRINMPPIDTFYVLPEEKELTPEEWDYYMELSHMYTRAEIEGRVKLKRDIDLGD